MYVLTWYTILRLLESGEAVNLKRLEDLLLGALPPLRGMVPNSSPQQLREEYEVALKRLKENGCSVEADKVIASSNKCKEYIRKELKRLEELRRLLHGTPLPYYLDEVDVLLFP